MRSTARLALASVDTSSSPSSRRDALGAAGHPAHRAAVLGDDVDADAAVGAAQLDRTELFEVARQGRLGDVDTLVGQQRDQLALAVHRPLTTGSPRSGRCRARAVRSIGALVARSAHRACSSSHTSSAFWACSRFSASSHTALCGPSITSSVIS